MSTPASNPARPAGLPLFATARRTTGMLVLSDGTRFEGSGFGAQGAAVGEVCFNTAMTGYQEIMTDPSYAAQIITFTFPHIGNVGTNEEDLESSTPFARGMIVKSDISEPSNWRASGRLAAWAQSRNLIGLAGIDTRRLTRLIRDKGFQNGVIAHNSEGKFDISALQHKAQSWPGLEGMDLAREVTCRQTYQWTETGWNWPEGYGSLAQNLRHVVAVDYGAKRNILRMLAGLDCQVTVVPATASDEEILRLKPDGVFLSNGPGDPAATAEYAVPAIRGILRSGVPIFGICLGHQLLALALGARTERMKFGHHGANHPVKSLASGKVEITSMNHGFAVARDSLPSGVVETHISLFDGSNCGLKLEDRPVFSVQYHPEASPGPQDSHYLFAQFIAAMQD